jgi:predicted RNA-binding protein with PIN domain
MFTHEATWYFDGYNVLHAVLLGRTRDVDWWRREYQQQVVAWVEHLQGRPPLGSASTTVVFDSMKALPETERVSSGKLTVVYTPNADDWILESCRLDSRTERWVVTGDRALGDRLKASGVRVLKPWQLDAEAQFQR